MNIDRLRNAADVAAWRLCTGCGACAYACTDGKVNLKDFHNDGIRPVIDEGCKFCGECLDVCPGIEQTIRHDPAKASKEWGPLLGVWEACSTDGLLRKKGSSGGAASAIALYCLEIEGMHGVLHTGSVPGRPWTNRTYLSMKSGELLERSGSRYSPASPCDGFKLIEEAPSPCVFIGKPCDCAALSKARRARPGLDAKTGLSIGIFCAGTPSTQGTLDLVDSLKIKTEKLKAIRYRGDGWPGLFKAEADEERLATLSYKEAWSFLQRYRPLRCHLCPDGTGAFADISCGDAWHREHDGGDGLSLLIARTEHGREILLRARDAGYIALKPTDIGSLMVAQDGLLLKKKAVWGRLFAMALMGVPIPRLKGFNLFGCWMKLGLAAKAKSVVGTLRRAFERGHFKKKTCSAQNSNRGENENRETIRFSIDGDAEN